MEAAVSHPHIEVRRISRHFGGVRAVDQVDLTIARGGIHALVGENGAGKSTLGKLIAGALTPTSGQLLVDGGQVEFRSPREALAAGIAILDQELAMVPARSVLDNVFLGSESSRSGLFRGRVQRARFAALVEHSGFDLDPDQRVESLRVADQQKVEVLRALARKSQLIVMDEPTAPLTQVESDRLYEVIRSLRDQGTTIVFVSHFLEEVLSLADTVTVMRDGKVVKTNATERESPSSLVRAMLGKSVSLAFPEHSSPTDAPVVLEADSVSAAGRFRDVSFKLHAGEILGLAGLVGSGRTEVARAVFGADPIDAGEIVLDGQPLHSRSPRHAIEAGIAMIPESRKDQGLVMTLSVSQNLVLPHLGDVSRGGILSGERERDQVTGIIEQLSVTCSAPGAGVTTLSGGNQQKVLFGKWLLGHAKVLIVDEPTRGVDVGAKQAIYGLLTSLAAGGMAVLLISSELDEVLGLSDRIIVMRQGRVAALLSAAQANETSVLSAAFGTGEEAIEAG